jgi:hypothetical protein
MDFKTIFDNEYKLIVGTAHEDLNTEVDNYIQKQIPSMKSEWIDSDWFSLFGRTINMNEGIYKIIYLDELLLATSTSLSSIVTQAYRILIENGFCVKRDKGVVTIDIFEIDTKLPVETHYQVASDNMLTGETYETCVFYTKKDEGVKGDLEVYVESPSFFSAGKKFVVPIISSMIMLRSGTLEYKLEDHIGLGKQHILSVHLEKL